MAESHVVSALKAKRAELAGEVEAAEKRIDQLRADLVHVDAVLRMYQPDLLPEAIPPRHQRPRDDWFGRGELARRIADTLREAGEPLCAREIALRIMVAKGLNPNDRELAAAFTKRSHQALRRRLRAGAVRSEPGPGQMVLWSVPRA